MHTRIPIPVLPAATGTFALASALAVVLATLPITLEAQEAKIQSAMSSAPASVATDATVMDWGMTVLREGSNGWTCLPDNPDTPGVDPMCLDEPWLEWIHGFMNQTDVRIDRIGFGYMLQPPEAGTSNLDPYAEGPTATNEWLETGTPHIMMIVPDEAMLEGLPTHPDHAAGPWVMWRGTPYVHVMIPTVPNTGSGG